MNNPNNMLIIESRSNYAFQLRGKNLSFSEIRNTSTAFFTSLPEGVRNELYNNMCHGTVKLDCEPELNAYMYAFGAMHNAKLKDAFSHLSTNFFNEREIDIIDYGCGQAMGCISYADYLRENNHTQNVRRITLIEPSYIALARAALHSSLLFPNAEIVTINKGFDDLTASDVEVDSNIPTLHIFSNVLDMGSTPNYNGVFNLGTFSNLVLEISKGYNEYVITEPLFSDPHRDEQADIFISSLLGINVYYEKKCNSGEFVANKNWTCVIKCGCVGLPSKDDIIPNNEIWYTTIDGKIIEPYMEDCSDIHLMSNTYIGGKGILTFIGNITSICSSAFSDCYELTSVVIPNSVRVIGEHAFSGCTNLASITIPDGVTSIGVWAFSDCISLTNIIIPNSITKIEESVFCRCESLASITIPNGITTICIDAFGGCSNLKSIAIPNTITVIDDCAFGGCKNLTHVTLPSGITKIGSYAFSGCASLTDVVIPESVIEIGGNAFSNCKNLKKIRGKFAQDNGRCLIKDGKLIAFAPAELTQYTIPNNVTEIGEGVFADCKSFSSIIIPDSVVTIGFGAFSGCSSLKEISIPNSVTEIGFDAFRHCVGITNITIPNNVEWIGWSAFVGCNNLKEFKGKFATDDGRCLICCGRLLAFAPAELTHYTIPNNVIIIDHNVFSGCNNLISISIPNSVQKIENGAFRGCSNLNYIILPGSVTTIGNWSFQGCSNLKSIYIKAITPPSLGHSAFIHESKGWDDKILGCMIYVPQCSVDAYIRAERWSEYAFQIKSIDVAENAIQPNDNILPNNEIWYQSSNDKPIKIIKTNHIPLSFNTIFLYGFGLLDSDGKENFGIEIISNENIDGKGVIRFDSSITTIRKGAFDEKYFNEARGEYASICRKEEFDRMFIGLSLFNNDDSANNGNDEKQKRELCKKSCIDILNYARLASVSLPNSVTIIEDEAFANCVCLASVNLGDNVVSIGNKAFYNCRQLSNIVIPNNTIYIGKGAFENCEHLTSITIPEGVTGIEEGVFQGCSNLTSVTIPDGVTEIGSYVFSGCRSLKSIILPNSVTTIEERVFQYCEHLTNITIPNGVTRIECNAFKDCHSLTSIILPNSITTIGKSAFQGCSNLTSITIPDGVIEIGEYAFSGCQNLISVSIPNSVTKIERFAFSDCSSLKSIDIPYGVFEIGDYAFSGRRVLAYIDIANRKVNEIFMGCKSLTSVSIPDSVTKIGRCAFDGCCNLRCINIPNSVKKIEKDAFSGCKKLPMKTKLKILKIRMGL